MAVRVGINGFGRIGRQSLKALLERAPDVEVVAVNDLVDAEMNALLFKHDSTYGAYDGDVRPATARSSSMGARSRSSPRRIRPPLPWGDLGVDIVLESTGIFTDADKATRPHHGRRPEGDHQRAGQERGHHDRPRGQRGSLRPGQPPRHQQRQLHDELPRAGGQGRPRPARHRAGADEHDPQLHERPAHPGRRPQGPPPRPGGRPEHHPDDDRRGQGPRPGHPGSQGQVRRLQPARPDARRSASSTSRPPSAATTSVDEINDAFRAAADGPLKGILGVSDEPLVSTDFRGDPRSSIIDAESTMVLGGDDGQGHRLVRQRVGL